MGIILYHHSQAESITSTVLIGILFLLNVLQTILGGRGTVQLFVITSCPELSMRKTKSSPKKR